MKILTGISSRNTVKQHKRLNRKQWSSGVTESSCFKQLSLESGCEQRESLDFRCLVERPPEFGSRAAEGSTPHGAGGGRGGWRRRT